MSVAKIIEQRSHIIPGKLKVTEWFFEVPKDYANINNGTLRLFARSAEKADTSPDPPKDEPKHLPWMVFQQGGPGFGCKPITAGGWTASAVDKGYKVLLLDQRGTGMSNTITAQLLAKQGVPADQAAYMKHFRADSIVKDSEAVRLALTKDYPENKKKWSVIGQSFGGFVITNYLSRFPEGLKEVFLCGGLPPFVKDPDVIYEKLCKTITARSFEYYEKFPEDVERMHIIAKYLTDNEVKTYTGGYLSFDRLRALGIVLGFHRGFEELHNLILRMWNDLETFQEFSRPTIHAFDSQGAFDTAVIYALLHEPCYLSSAAGNWSAERVLSTKSEFRYPNEDPKAPILFTSEMITKSMFRDYGELSGLKETADILAAVDDWPDLYDEAQLAKNTVPVYSATYYDDIYVDFDFARETASKIKGAKLFITNTMYHDSLGTRGEEVMKELFAIRDEEKD